MARGGGRSHPLENIRIRPPVFAGVLALMAQKAVFEPRYLG